MRYFFLFCCLLAASPSFAQGNDPYQLFHTITGNLDLSETSTGYLYDITGNLGNPMYYDGTGEKQIGIGQFLTLYNGLREMDVSSNNYNLPLTEQLRAAIEGTNSGNIPIGILLHEYDRIDADALDNNLFTLQNGQLSGTLNHPNSPPEIKPKL